MAKSSKVIGILGGVGPEAGLDLHGKVLVKTPRSGRDQDHLEVLLHTNTRIPDRTEFLLGRSADNPSEELIRSARILAQSGAEILAIPCITAHAKPIFDPVREFVRGLGGPVQLLSMVEETCRALSAIPADPVGILATDGTLKHGVYTAALAWIGRTALVPEQTEQAMVMDAIYNLDYGLKAGNDPARRIPGELLRDVARSLIERGAKGIVKGCTEIPLALTESSLLGRPLIDPTEILAEALVAAAMGSR